MNISRLYFYMRTNSVQQFYKKKYRIEEENRKEKERERKRETIELYQSLVAIVIARDRT